MHCQYHKVDANEPVTATNFNIFFVNFTVGARGPVTSADFDTSLLYTLLRNTVKITPPTSGWNKEPNPADISKGDDVERIRFARNSLCHGKTSMDQSTFNSKWTCLSQVCALSLCCMCGYNVS